MHVGQQLGYMRSTLMYLGATQSQKLICIHYGLVLAILILMISHLQYSAKYTISNRRTYYISLSMASWYMPIDTNQS